MGLPFAMYLICLFFNPDFLEDWQDDEVVDVREVRNNISENVPRTSRISIQR